MNVVIAGVRGVAVKEVVLPCARCPGSDPVLGPEMRSTGEVMGFAPDFATSRRLIVCFAATTGRNLRIARTPLAP